MMMTEQNSVNNEQRLMDRLLEKTRRQVETNMRLLTDAGQIAQLSNTLQELAALGSTMNKYNSGEKLDLTFDEPLRIPTDVPKPKLKKMSNFPCPIQE